MYAPIAAINPNMACKIILPVPGSKYAYALLLGKKKQYYQKKMFKVHLINFK